MLALALLAVLQQQPPSRTETQRRADSIAVSVQRRINEHSAAEEASKVRADERRKSDMARLPGAIATAFKDNGARDLLNRARTARRVQDSMLVSYDAKSYQRVSAWMGFGRLTRDRLIFRTEQSGRVRWQRDVGIWMDVTGARTALPGIPPVGEKEARKSLREESGDMIPVPYYPGAEPLWAGQELTRDTVRFDEIIHPLAVGAELYYTYASGDSVDLTLGNGVVVPIRSLEIRPRAPAWNLVVGSLWFDTRTAQLVRAAYRFAAPMHIDAFVEQEDPHAFDDVPVWVKPMIFPMHAELAAVTIEYSLHDSRFWLPKARYAQGSGTASFMRVPFTLEQSFTYNSVNGLDSLPKIPQRAVLKRPTDLDSAGLRAWMDSIAQVRRATRLAHRDSLRARLIPPDLHVCDTSAVTVDTRHINDSKVLMAVRLPCDTLSLENSPDLPKSIFDPGDELFDEASRKELIDQALSISAQPPFMARMQLGMLPKPTYNYGLYMTRFNRVEGLSVGAGIEQELGGGYTGNIVGRLSTARWTPDAELSLTRSNLTSTMIVSGYHRLESAGDWGNPLSFGSSLSGILFGRDEGLYYRSTGVSIGGRNERGPPADFRFFVENERQADVSTTFGLMSSNHLPNVATASGTYLGATMRMRGTYGLDPNGFRIFSNLRLEGAKYDSLYGRAALDLTFTQGFPSDYGAALTVAGGSSVGAVPPQRRWYLGGTETIRGELPDVTQGGDAFWMTRLEFGRTFQGSRGLIFGDLGWAGDRDRLREVGRPMSGVGVGASIMDGLIRFDLARGIYPAAQWRFIAYLDGVF